MYEGCEGCEGGEYKQIALFSYSYRTHRKMELNVMKQKDETCELPNCF